MYGGKLHKKLGVEGSLISHTYEYLEALLKHMFWIKSEESLTTRVRNMFSLAMTQAQMATSYTIQAMGRSSQV